MKTNRFRAIVFVDIFIDDDIDTNLEDQKMEAILKANEIKNKIGGMNKDLDCGISAQVTEVFSNPFGNLPRK